MSHGGSPSIPTPLPSPRIIPAYAGNACTSAAESALRDAAREYHAQPSPGKITVRPTKPLSNQRDLSLAYSPGVAYAFIEYRRRQAEA